VEVERGLLKVGLRDKVMLLGSCFADEIGRKMTAAGFDVCVNPFGTLYNPASIASALRRLESGIPFTTAEVVEMGAGAGLLCSFSHHTSFARPTAAEFLEAANASLASAHEFWLGCNRLLVTLGTAFVWEHGGTVVSNCLKRPASEFTRRMLGLQECEALVREIASYKETLVSVSPIRHLSDGAHSNSLSKATLMLAASEAGVSYFPAYEILLDELRDYRFFAEDLVHPSKVAVDVVWEKFLGAVVPEADWNAVRGNEKASRSSAHHSMR